MLQLKSQYKESSIDNLHFRSHGSTETLGIGGVQLDENSLKQKVEFSNNGLSFYIGRKGDVNALKEDGYSDKEIENYKSFIELSNYVKNEGNFFFSSCQVGYNSLFTNRIVSSFSVEKTFDFYFNIGNGGTTLENVSYSIKCNGPKCKYTNNISTYISSKPAGTVTDVILNNTVNNPYTIIK